MTNESVTSGYYMGNAANGQYGGQLVNTKNYVEDYLLNEYQAGIRNEFAIMDALINKLSKDTISGTYKVKQFAVGITDNIHSIGQDNFDRYELGMGDFDSGSMGDTIEAMFDTTKVMATFGLTDEFLMKAQSQFAMMDLLQNKLDQMDMGLQHTYKRFTYGGHDGIIGKISSDISVAFSDSVLSGNTASSGELVVGREARGKWHNKFHNGLAPKFIKFKMSNHVSLVEGMGAMIEVHVANTTTTTNIASAKRIIGRVFQKDASAVEDPYIIFRVEKVLVASAATGTMASPTITWGNAAAEPDFGSSGNLQANANTGVIFAATNNEFTVYSRQLNNAGTIADEYHGLEDIVIRSTATDSNAVIFGVDRRMFPSLRCTIQDYQGNIYLNEEGLRNMTDHLMYTTPMGSSISLVCAQPQVISTVEKSLYQFKNYNLTSTQQGMQLGGSAELRFDNFTLYKDLFARDNNVYFLDTGKIGELVRRDFTWITSGGPMGILERRDGTEFFEGIMNKYADMYIDAWRCHAAIKNVKTVASATTFLGYNTDGTPITRTVTVNPTVTVGDDE